MLILLLLDWIFSRSPEPSSSGSGEFHVGLGHRSAPHRLGLAMLPPNAPDVQCSCWATLRHDILTGILCPAGIVSTLVPALRGLPGLTNRSRTSADGSPSRPGAQGDILLAMPQGICIADVSAMHPLSINSLSARRIGRSGSTRSGPRLRDRITK
jgi:hypothetical protein